MEGGLFAFLDDDGALKRTIRVGAEEHSMPEVIIW